MIRAHFSALDGAILATYFIATVIVGFWKRRRGTEEYLIAARRLSLPVFVATLVATWYGGILASGEFTYDYGIANWTTQGLPYYVFALVFALFLATRVREASLYTIPDKLHRTYGRPAALLGAVYAFIMITPAPYILMVGRLVQIAFGWPELPAILVGTLFSVAYVYAGGFESDVRINVFQFLLMFGGFAAALPVLIHRLGGFHWLAAHVPPTHLRLDGGQDLGFILVWFFIAVWTLVDPGFHQRCYAARTPSVARTGILAAIVCWAAFDFLTTTTGLYARAALPVMPPGTSHDMAYPLLAEIALPSGIKGLFYLGMLATVMSTVVSYTFIGAMTVGRDFVWRLREDATNESVPVYTRWGLVVTTVLGIAIALAVPSVVRQWYAIGTVCVPGMLIAVLAGYAPRWQASAEGTFACMLAGGGTAAICLLAGWLGRHGLQAATEDFPFHLQPMYPGLLASAAVYLAARSIERVRGRVAVKSPSNGGRKD
ncbi:MAG: sodium:solute symporter family protein [Chthonomonadales bacterium]